VWITVDIHGEYVCKAGTRREGEEVPVWI